MKTVSLVFYALVGLGAVAAAAYFFPPLLRQRASRSDYLAELRRSNEVLEVRIGEQTRMANENQTNPDAAELTAMQNGLSRPGEIVFVFAAGE